MRAVRPVVEGEQRRRGHRGFRLGRTSRREGSDVICFGGVGTSQWRRDVGTGPHSGGDEDVGTACVTGTCGIAHLEDAGAIGVGTACARLRAFSFAKTLFM